jgi:hypothetical protein
MHGENRNAYRVLMGKSEGNRPLRRPRCRWEDNIKMDLREIGWDVVYWIRLNWDRDNLGALLNMIMNLRVWGFLEYLSDWRLLKKDSAP